MYRTQFAQMAAIYAIVAPDATAHSTPWEDWLKSKVNTSCFVTVKVVDVTNDGWKQIIKELCSDSVWDDVANI